MADNDPYALQKTDPCYATFEAYRQYLAPRIDNFWQVTQYRDFAADLEQVKYCCPGGKRAVAKARADQSIPKSFEEIPLPSVFIRNTPCYSTIDHEGYRWRRDYSNSREQYWKNYYFTLDNHLHTCCADRFNACLAEAVRTSGAAPGEPAASEAYARCSEILTAGAVSPLLITLGVLALLIGFHLGLPGRTRPQAKFTAGVTSALVALFVYFLCVEFFSDQRTSHLLLALTVAIVTVAFRTWVRIRLVYRGSGPAPAP